MPQPAQFIHHRAAWTEWRAPGGNGVHVSAAPGHVTMTMVRDGHAISTIGVPLDTALPGILASAIAVAAGHPAVLQP